MYIHNTMVSLQIIRTNDAERYIKVIPSSYEDLSLSDTDGVKVNSFALWISHIKHSWLLPWAI